jgi:hypothetical protein
VELSVIVLLPSSMDYLRRILCPMKEGVVESSRYRISHFSWIPGSCFSAWQTGLGNTVSLSCRRLELAVRLLLVRLANPFKAANSRVAIRSLFLFYVVSSLFTPPPMTTAQNPAPERQTPKMTVATTPHTFRLWRQGVAALLSLWTFWPFGGARS